jgi:succinylglutamate desuccinylase
MYKVISEIPAKFFDIEVTQVDQVFDGPTLIDLKGAKDETLFISTLLHGNETTGFYALQNI